MSTEKEIVNFWLNKQGYFTISNLKEANRDLGIISIKSGSEVCQYEVACSLTNNAQDSADRIISEKFSNKRVQKAIAGYMEGFKASEIKKFVVLSNNVNQNTIKKFSDNNIEIIKFENVLADVMKGLDMQYYKNDVIRSLQLMKYIFMSNSKNVADLLIDNVMSQSGRSDFMKELLEKDDIMREFRKTNQERLTEILKHSVRDPKKLAEMLENDVLNRKTRKTFLSSLLEQKKMKKLYREEFAEKKAERPLNRFF